MLLFNKVLPIFILPLGLALFLLVWGLWRKKRWPVALATMVVWLASTPIVGGHLFHWLEASYPALPLDGVAKVDAVVPLGGIFGPPAAEGTQLNIGEGGERLEAGIELWQHAKADWLVFTGGRIPWARQAETEGEALRRVAISRGVAPDRIIVTSEVANTSDEARVVAQLARERGWKKIILVTSAYHMPRAARLFRKARVSFLPFPVDFQTDDLHGPITLLHLLPQADALLRTETVLREALGMLFYALIGRG